MENTTEPQPLTETEIEAIGRIEVDQDWHNDAQSRIAHAEVLLDRISYDIETVPAQAREHAADLLDSAIEALSRMARRFSSLDPDPAAQEPPSEPRRYA